MKPGVAKPCVILHQNNGAAAIFKPSDSPALMLINVAKLFAAGTAKNLRIHR